MRKGKGRYRDTHIVTFAPRYLLDNRSRHKLAFSQREFARGKVSRDGRIIHFISIISYFSVWNLIKSSLKMSKDYKQR